MWNNEKIKDYWQERANKNDNPCHYFNKWQDRYAEKVRLSAFKKQDFARAQKIVDIGCGVGDYTVKFSNLTDGRIVGFDFPFNIEIARRKYPAHPRITFRTGSIPHDDIANEIKDADMVILTTVYNHLTDDARNALVEYCAAMKPGVAVYMLEYFPESVPEFQKGLGYKEIETWQQAVGRFDRGGLKLTEMRPVNYIDSFFFHHLGPHR